MLTSNSMRFCTDVFGVTQSEDEESSISVAAFQKKALLICKTSWDCSGFSSVDGFEISGEQQEDTDRRFMFKIGDKFYKFTGGVPVEYTGNTNVDGILKYGNTASAIGTLTSIPDFIGKKISPVIALESHNSSGAVPTVKMAIKRTKGGSSKTTHTEESIVYELTDDDTVPVITECVADTTCTGNGAVEVKIRLKKNDSWSSYMDLNEAVEKEAEAVQVKATYSVSTTNGDDSAFLNYVAIDHTYGKAIVAAKNCNLFSKVVDYENDLSMCYTVVKHEPLRDSNIEAYVNFMKPPKTREITYIGTGNGSRKEFTLGVDGTADTNIDTTSIKIYEDDVEISDYSYSSATSTVTLVTTNKAIYTATYKYEHGVEEWRQMTLNEREPVNDGSGLQTSRFSYGFDSTDGMSTANVRLHLVRRSGTVSNNMSLGPATGKRQVRVLKHPAKESSIKATGTNLSLSYNPETNSVSYVAKAGTDISFSYSWVGENVIIYSWVTGFTVA